MFGTHHTMARHRFAVDSGMVRGLLAAMAIMSTFSTVLAIIFTLTSLASSLLG